MNTAPVRDEILRYNITLRISLFSAASRNSLGLRILLSTPVHSHAMNIISPLNPKPMNLAMPAVTFLA